MGDAMNKENVKPLSKFQKMLIEKLNKEYRNLIIDNAHSFYSAPQGIASFNSLRKFFPKIKDGAFLYTKKFSNINYPKDNYSYNPHILKSRKRKY